MATNEPVPAQPPTGAPGDEGEASSGDYSYDLAHDMGTEPHRRQAATPHRSGAAAEAPPPGEDGDYSYDLAHEVPPASR
jgi:hypothetical protein